jgi:hypothetical protein
MSQQTSLNLSINFSKEERDSATTHDKVVESSLSQAYSPYSSSSPRLLNTSPYPTQYSTGLLTPCRQVGLRRKSFRNVISPSSSDSEPVASPVNARFVCPAGSSKRLGRFSSRVLDKHIPHEKESSEYLGKRLNMENMNEKAKQCRYERKEEPIRDQCEETDNNTENFNNKSQKSDIRLSKDTNIQNKSDAYIMISCGNSDREKADLELQSSNSNDTQSVIISKHRKSERLAERTRIENVDDQTQQCNADTPTFRTFVFQNNSNNEKEMVNSEIMMECTEENLNVLKQQIAIKEEEVKRLKLILLYKKKVMDIQFSLFLCLVQRLFRFGIFPSPGSTVTMHI